MSLLPVRLAERLTTEDAAIVDRAVAGMLHAICEQYERERRAFDRIEGDNARTCAWNMREHSWARMAENFEDDAEVIMIEEGLTQAVHAGGLIIRPYKLGSQVPLDINLVRLDPSSGIKVGLGERNRQVVEDQLAFDLASAMSAPTEAELEAAYAARELVLGHFGNAAQGRRAVYLGAPRDTLAHGSYWEWGVPLAGEAPPPDPDVLPEPASPGPPDKPYSERAEPDLQLARRRDRRRRDAPS
jgi:hypothetical protein